MTDCRFSGADRSRRPLLDLGFLDAGFVRETGVETLIVEKVVIRDHGVGVEELGPFFDGRKVVHLVGCRYCGHPCSKLDGACPEWASVQCVMSS